MLYRDYCGVKKVENQQLYTIQSQDRQIIALKKANDFLSKKDSVNSQIILKDSILNLDLGRKLDDANFNLAKNKRAKIGMAIAVPVAAILSFVFGWYLHVR